jgi:signal transduction histidine kinase
LRPDDARPWGFVGASIVVLLVVIGLAGIVGVVANERVKDAAERGIRYDVEIEDTGDDLRVAVLELRHRHRNIVFGGPSESAIGAFDAAYVDLFEEIADLEAIGVEGLDIAQPNELRAMAQAYHDEFRPRIALFTSDPIGFQAASAEGLVQIEEMELATEEIDDLGEQLTAQLLNQIGDEAIVERVTLISLLAAVALVGVALAVAAGRVVDRLRIANAQEQAATQRLAAALRTKSDFIADASHELRTPLTLVRGNAETGLSVAEGEEQRQILGEIVDEAARMSRIVEDLLFLAQSEAGALSMEREYLPSRLLVTRVATQAEARARHHDRCLTCDVEVDGHVEVDPERIQQVVLILMDNVARHTPEGPCAELSARTAGGELRLEVADAGPGIPPDEIPLLFERFYQAGDRRARKRGGSGLGLAIAKMIVEAHGGTIGIASEVGRGSRVTVRLPLVTPR